MRVAYGYGRRGVAWGVRVGVGMGCGCGWPMGVGVDLGPGGARWHGRGVWVRVTCRCGRRRGVAEGVGAGGPWVWAQVGACAGVGLACGLAPLSPFCVGLSAWVWMRAGCGYRHGCGVDVGASVGEG